MSKLTVDELTRETFTPNGEGYITVFDPKKGANGNTAKVSLLRAKLYPYGRSPVNPLGVLGKPKKGTKIWGFEPEFVGIMTPEVIAQLSHNYRGFVERDCSVDCEVAAPPRYNLCGESDRAIASESIEGITMTDPRCGYHITYSSDTFQTMDFDTFKHRLLNAAKKLQYYLAHHEEECVRIFGRTFNEYAKQVHGNGDLYNHFSWVHYRGVDSRISENAGVEFRLPHYVNERQLVIVATLVADLYDGLATCEDWVEIFKKYANGKAAVCKRSAKEEGYRYRETKTVYDAKK